MGCVNLTAVRHLATASAEGQVLAEIAAELPASPGRRLRYTENPTVRGQLERDVVEGRRAQRAVLAGHRVVQAYLDTLGDLAVDGRAARLPELDDLSEVVKDSDVFSPQDVEAFRSLSRLLGHMATDRFRQATLRRFVADTEAPLQVVLASLDRTIRERCVRELETERKMAVAYYDDALRDTGGAAAPALVVLVREARDARLEALDGKIQRCRDYGDVLRKIATAHADLVRHRDEIGRREGMARLREYAREIESAQAALRAARR